MPFRSPDTLATFVLLTIGVLVIAGTAIGLLWTIGRLLLTWCVFWLPVLIRTLWRWVWRLPPDEFGSAHWRSVAEMGDLTDPVPGGIVLGTYDSTELIDRSSGHCLIVGPTGSWKSSSVYRPTLERWQGSAIVLDVKSELEQMTGKARESYGPVYTWCPTRLGSHRLNPLDLVRWDTDFEVGDLQRVSVALLATDSAIGEGPDRFRNLYEALLPGCLAHCRAPLGEVLTWMTSAPLKDLVDDLIHSHHPTAHQAGMVLQSSTAIMQSMGWLGLQRVLRLWADPIIAAQTSCSDLDVMGLQSSREPVTVYLHIPDGDRLRVRPLLRLFLD